jgi:hypothetical protein
MILDRLYTPADNELIYHYCRPEAFLEIIKSRTGLHPQRLPLQENKHKFLSFRIFI